MFISPPIPWPRNELFLLGLGIAAASWLFLSEPHRSMANSLALALWIIAAVLAVDRQIQKRRQDRRDKTEGGRNKRPPSSPRKAS
jgi:hypothetical protein